MKGKIKLMTVIVTVKPTKYISNRKMRSGGKILIETVKLKYAVGKKVKVIIRTHYTGNKE